MGDLLYNDGMIAVVDFEGTQGGGIDEQMVKLLLDLTPENVDKYMAKLLKCFATASYYYENTVVPDGHEWAVEAYANADLQKLESLGIDTRSTILQLNSSNDMMRRYLVSVPHTEKKSLGVADCAQYLAQLYLLSQGDKRQEDLIPEVVDHQGYLMSFDAVLPWGFRSSLMQNKLTTCAMFDLNSIETVEEGNTFSIHVDVQYLDVGIFLPNEMPKGEFSMKTIVASALLSSIINYQTALRFATDKKTHELKRSNDGMSVAPVMAECIIAKKICACPWCGRPVLRLRKSSKPFCRQSHQTRYSEKAHKAFDKGASVDEIAAAFPYIKRATIENW